MLPDEKTIEEIKAKVAPRDIHQLDIAFDGEELYTLIVATPTKAEWLKYASELTGAVDFTRKVSAHENFVLCATQWPIREEVKDFINRKFGVVGQIANQLSTMVGADGEVKTKKL